MYQSSSIRKHQRGDMLVEAMIGLLLMGILGTALVLAAGRANAALGEITVRNGVVTQLRQMLEKNGGSGTDLCNKPTQVVLPDSRTLQVLVTGCQLVSVRVGGVTVGSVHQPLKLQVKDDALGGVISVGGGR